MVQIKKKIANIWEYKVGINTKSKMSKDTPSHSNTIEKAMTAKGSGFYFTARPCKFVPFISPFEMSK